MTQATKHVGSLVSGSKIALVMSQLPDSPLRALIIELDSLPPYHSELIRNVLVSEAAQNARDLVDVMGATNVPGVGRSLMMEFHKQGLMRSESIDNIILTPNAKTAVPLREVLSAMGRLGVAAVMASKAEQSTTPIVEATVYTPEQEAAKMIAEAEVLEERARILRDNAAALTAPVGTLEQSAAI